MTQTLTLPGPSVTRSVSWDQIRSYLLSTGWTLRNSDKGLELWLRVGSDGAPGTPHVWVGCIESAATPDEQAKGMRYAMVALSHFESCSPGEVLARVADAVPSAAEAK